jgi:hypothetical protein
VNTAHFTIKQTMPSPDEEYVAVAFLNNGNSLTSYRPYVVILKRNEKLRYTKNKGIVFAGYRSKYVNIFWKSERKLVIEHNCLDEYIFRRTEKYNDIYIEYIQATKESISPDDIKDFEYGDYFNRVLPK